MKRYGAVKVKNPSTNGHTVRLLPLQSFEIVCTRCDPADRFNALVVGDSLLMTETLEQDHNITFRFQQKYDTTEWVKISDLFMGNVLLTKSIGGVKEKLRLCVYCTDAKSPKDNVLTVINPDDVLVKMEPYQILHIVSYDEQMRWSLDNCEGLKCVRCETVINDFQKIYDQDALFCPEPRSHGFSMNKNLGEHPDQFFTNEVMGARGLTTEYHFWSCLTAAQINRMYSASNGTYSLGTIELKGESEKCGAIRKMELMLGVRGKKKINLEHFKAIYSLAKCWNERSLSYLRHSLFNPRVNENLDVSDADGWFYVEIPNPSVYFNDFSDDGSWKFQEADDTVICHELRERYINGNKVQRFLITGITNQREAELMSLGSVLFSCSEGDADKQMRLSFWKIPNDQTRPLSQEMLPRRSGRSRLIEKVEIELEIVSDGVLASEDTITPLCCIDENDIDYTEFGEEYVSHLISKKKIPLLLGVSSSTTSANNNAALVQVGTEMFSVRNIAS